MYKKLKHKKIYQDKYLSVHQDEVEFSNGAKGTHAWINRIDGVGIVPITPDKKILLIKQHRYVIGEYSWEIPGGGIDKDETPQNAARRELHEETGIKAEKFENLGVFYPLNSLNTEKVTNFYCIIEDVSPTNIKSESSEDIAEYRFISFSKALEMIDSGEINDAMTANAIQMVIRKLNK